MYEKSGYEQMYEKYGDDYSWSECPRAKIFRRNESMIHDVITMKAIMQYNKFVYTTLPLRCVFQFAYICATSYLHDPLSDNNPTWAIASRADLLEEAPFPMGGIDSKFTSNKLQTKGTSYAISGPTHAQLAPFDWGSNFPNWLHDGQPQVYPIFLT